MYIKYHEATLKTLPLDK
jgi:hypothetical protein